MAEGQDIAGGLILREDGTRGCSWHGDDPLYRRYHDEEWGRPAADDDRLFEKLCLEGFQAGLSWLTILRKREAFRSGFHGFSIARVAEMNDRDIERLLADPGIVRHRGKIASAINNARRARELQADHGSLAAFLWSFEPSAEERPHAVTAEFLRATPSSPASTRLSKALKKAGFTFVGPTTVYAFMQSMGFVNDHIEGCAVRSACEAERDRFVRPK
ncbi:DNA-3-methyladenine glycosylase I [Jiella marina]|uniref:DNA-3-methyladenine glycosylase I n=1 Tax=Jiella sp. LLJ827 TaxID=2917712 RepID=UPI002100A071|nr:DNA-3-methyladenine glycosylase I [Jiella sp. LLJ827]MCQ0986559.1 DNA-3-methyladenine glycosylase I [Jiella sp. LLJ827]